MTPSPLVTGLAVAPRHRFSKEPRAEVRLVAGHGVEGDAHAGATVQHRSRKRWRPQDPNLRQVHLLAGELLEELRTKGYDVGPGRLGENVTTSGVDLLALPTGTVLRLGDDAEVEVTGLRNPCVQIDRYSEGLMGEVVDRDEDGAVVRRAGVMGVVLRSGTVRVGDPLTVVLPALPHHALRPV
ncbi:MAG TPA: MOSC domain-containing protein [Nocardioides sp.]|nr:MOSC domain-containing protein [Nocardioides sp.]